MTFNEIIPWSYKTDNNADVHGEHEKSRVASCFFKLSMFYSIIMKLAETKLS